MPVQWRIIRHAYGTEGPDKRAYSYLANNIRNTKLGLLIFGLVGSNTHLIGHTYAFDSACKI